MKETIYTDKCPVHGQSLTTKRTRDVSSISSITYTGPEYYCAKCRAYYIIIDELSSGYKAKHIAPSGLPIYVLGKKKLPVNKAQTPPRVIKNQSNKNIFRNIKYGKIEINVIPEGSQLPKKCDSCNSYTYRLEYMVKDKTGKKEILVGKECSVCHKRFYSEEIYNEYADCFIVKKSVTIMDGRNNVNFSDSSPVNYCEKNKSPAKENQAKIEEHQVETDIKTLNYDEHKENDLMYDKQARSIVDFTHEDDFGRKYDFSELSAFLNL